MSYTLHETRMIRVDTPPVTIPTHPPLRHGNFFSSTGPGVYNPVREEQQEGVPLIRDVLVLVQR